MSAPKDVDFRNMHHGMAGYYFTTEEGRMGPFDTYTEACDALDKYIEANQAKHRGDPIE